MKSFLKLLFFLFLITVFSSCHKKVVNPNRNLSIDSFSALKTRSYVVNSKVIRKYILRMINSDSDSMVADYRTRSYYIRRRNFLWIDRHGVDERADKLMAYLQTVDEMGFSRDKFRVAAIEKDLQCLRSLDVADSSENNINKVYARLEYNLTKAYLRYVTGQRFGFVNPQDVFNRLDVKDRDSSHVSYRGLFDINMQLPKRIFFAVAIRKICNDSVGEFLRSVQPKSPLYARLKAMLNDGKVSGSERPRIMCNMERCRWRLSDYPAMHKKFVLVNIPSFRLLAKDDNDSLWMRIVCGTFDTKTPLLTSMIMRMDVNPQWVIPRSIIEKDILRHAGNKGYFDSHHFFVRDRRTGKKIDPCHVTWAMLNSKDYLVMQEGGEGNSLGRIIFRFDNNFSVFMHDTSAKDVFSRDIRGISHGCIRVEKPFDLAVFMLKEKNEEIIDKIKYSMNADVSSYGKKKIGGANITDTLDRSKLVNSIAVIPQIPIFITYFTLYPSTNGKLSEYADVYGYDHAIYCHLRNYR